jgi:hypothetical protein
MLALSFGRAFAQDDRWFFSADEIANAYRYQQQFGARLRNPLEPQACFQGESEFSAFHHGRRFAAPCRFVGETMRQLKELLESGAARYLFPLDLASADLAVPATVYESKYAGLPREDVLPALLNEPTLVAIYRTAMHLCPEGGVREAGLRAWGEARIIAGFYDGRRNEMLAPRSDGKSDYETVGLVRVGDFAMMGHFLGELTLVANDAVITFDLSFENERASAPAGAALNVSAAPK